LNLLIVTIFLQDFGGFFMDDYRLLRTVFSGGLICARLPLNFD